MNKTLQLTRDPKSQEHEREKNQNIFCKNKKKLYAAGVSKILIERTAENQIRVIVLTGRPGMVIGRSGNGVDELKSEIVKITGKNVSIDIKEVRRTELDAQLVAENIAQSLERRVSFRRAMKQAMGRTMKAGAKGVKVLCRGEGDRL